MAQSQWANFICDANDVHRRDLGRPDDPKGALLRSELLHRLITDAYVTFQTKECYVDVCLPNEDKRCLLAYIRA